MENLKVADKAPNFKLNDQNENEHSLADYLKSWVLLYFYPKDDTPGCTKEACEIRDSFSEYKTAGITVLGVSVDSIESHKKFEKKYSLPFTLLADEDKKVVKMYGVWRQKNSFGIKKIGTVRTSFLINPEGKIAKIYESVKPELHAEQVLKDVATLAH